MFRIEPGRSRIPVEIGSRWRAPRKRDEKHLRWIRTLPSLIRGTGDVEAAHVRYGDALYEKPPTGLGEKPSDCWTVPLAHELHVAQHRENERSWWESQGIDPVMIAILLFTHSGNHEAGINIIRNARRFCLC